MMEFLTRLFFGYPESEDDEREEDEDRPYMGVWWGCLFAILCWLVIVLAPIINWVCSIRK